MITGLSDEGLTDDETVVEPEDDGTVVAVLSTETGAAVEMVEDDTVDGGGAPVEFVEHCATEVRMVMGMATTAAIPPRIVQRSTFERPPRSDPPLIPPRLSFD